MLSFILIGATLHSSPFQDAVFSTSVFDDMYTNIRSEFETVFRGLIFWRFSSFTRQKRQIKIPFYSMSLCAHQLSDFFLGKREI